MSLSLSLSSVHVKLLVSSLPDGVCPRPDANGGGADGAELGQIHCLIDLMTLSLDVSMTFLWSLILIYTVRLRSSASSSIERYPLHDTRWLLCLCLMVNRLAELASCLIVAISGPLVGSHQLALYLPLFDIFTLIICCIFYDRIEVWRRGFYVLCACPYWSLAIGLNVIRHHQFPYPHYDEMQSSKVPLRLVTIWMAICLSAALLLVDLITSFQARRVDKMVTSETSALPPVDIQCDDCDSVFTRQEQQTPAPPPPMNQWCYLHSESNLLSKATFYWLNPLLWTGYWTPLEQQHLGRLPDRFRASQLGQQLRQCLDKGGSLWRCYWSFSWPAIVLGGLLKFSGDLVGYVAPLGIQYMVTYLATDCHANKSSIPSAEIDFNNGPSVNEFISNGYVMAVIVFLASFAQGALSQSSSHVLCVEGIRLKTALQSFMYAKSLRLSSLNGVVNSNCDDGSNSSASEPQQPPEDGPIDAGTCSQLLTEDCGNVMVLLCHGHYVWAIPLKLAVLLYLLHEKLGVGSVVAALLCLVIMVPAQFLLGGRISHTNKQSLKEAERRLAKTLEWLSNMKLFRLYAWEKAGMKRIEAVRQRELRHLWSYSLQWAWATFLTQASTVALTLLTFVLYRFFNDQTPPAAQALSGLALINQFTVPLTIIPVIVPDLISAFNSTSRLEQFFRRPEVGPHPPPIVLPPAAAPPPPAPPTERNSSRRMLENIVEDSEESHSMDNWTDSIAIRLDGATFAYQESDSSSFRLKDIQLDVKRGRLTAVVGHVGSGKSTLLVALLGELQLESGQFNWMRNKGGGGGGGEEEQQQVGYVAQRPWLMHASLRDNILFGNALHSKRYSKVIESCALSHDIEGLENKDLTVIGSRGQNVSGGQKARIAMARAVYSPAHTVLLDDPFAGLDHPVAQHVFRQAVQRVLLRQGRNVIMATHHMEYARSADHVVVMDNGRVLVQGSPDQVAIVWPELVRIEPTSRSNTSSPAQSAKDRWNMLRIITKTGSVFKSVKKTDDCGAQHQQQQQSTDGHRWKRRSSRLNALSIHMSHDLPLLTDEMMIEEALPEGRAASIRRERLFTNSGDSVRKRHISSLNGPPPEALPSAPQQPRSISFSLRNPSSSTGGALLSNLLMMRNRRSQPMDRSRSSRDRLTAGISLHPLADSTSTDGRPSLLRLSSAPVATNPDPDAHGQRKFSSDSTESYRSVSQRSNNHQPLDRLVSNVSAFSDDMANNDDFDSNADERGLLVDPAAADEQRQYGRVPRRLYWIYARSCGLALTLSYFIGSLGWQAARLATDYYLVVYQIQPLEASSDSSDHHLLIYSLLSVASVMAALLTNILGQAAGSRGRRRLHDDMLKSLSLCHPRLFDLEPTGRLLNRFNTDTSMIDKKLATTFQRLVQFVLMCLSAIVVNVVISPWSLLVATLIVAIFYCLQRIFRTSARELQRLESLTKAPVVSHLTETLSGLSTLRAFGQQKHFAQTMTELIDSHTSAVLVLNSTNRWLGFALDSLGAAAVLVAMLLALVVYQQRPEQMTAAQVGLAINYTLMTPIYLQWVVRFWSELEMYFNAVERVLHYSNLRAESATTEAGAGGIRWPMRGDIEIVHLSVTYQANVLDPVVRDLTLSIRHGEKVGICGRTGSGKSTLVNALFRLADTASGSVHIDGVDIATLQPHYLRSKLAAVPQDTLVIAGTLRDNLDPEHEIADDDKLWSVLEAVRLKETFRSSGLDGELSKNGSCNLSVGQQQLLSLARAALRLSPIIVLDEPSSALDQEAEQTLHHCFDHLFHDRTILLVAHRISTLMKCDRICWLENGQLVMQGTPDQVISQLPIDE